ncbi:hypothetical protein B4Q13_22500 [Lacticaseibacillus rhamnosus]
MDNGLLRYDEANQIQKRFREKLHLPLDFVDATDTFLTRLDGVTDPEQKRKIIGATFIDVFERRAHELGGFDFLGQGTLYPDVIESASVLGPAVVIKSHHNVGGLLTLPVTGNPNPVVAHGLGDAKTIGLTVEPAHGSVQPTTPPILLLPMS